ncbi:hypothetical protein PGTUg99_019608 [Puccinia graminis f. sp. tritici]|uniref:Uncharacterized protein n=1 Tax=Puccinia graminis f. sp. tritici TaxID=56615 RepID=A0A5B0R9F9_PUCGR|nr:hypothetical protein PGTUg99_019608 [Puccinia graminis f. sp. tritici]
MSNPNEHTTNHPMSPSRRLAHEWLQQQLNPDGTFGKQSAHSGPHVPQLFDGTAHLSRNVNRETHLDPLLTQSQYFNTFHREQSSQSEETPVIAPVRIEFTLHLPAVNQVSRSHKRKEPPSSVPSTEKVNSELDKLILDWPIGDKDLRSFKSAVIKLIHDEENGPLAGFVETQESERNIRWDVSIINGGTFAATHNQHLDSADVFQHFLDVAGTARANQKVTCRLVQKDPKAIAKKQNAYKSLEANASTSNSEPPRVPSNGALSAMAHRAILEEIYAAHGPCERVSGSPEKQVFINPENINEFFALTLPRVNLWAKAIYNVDPASVTAASPSTSNAVATSNSGNTNTTTSQPIDWSMVGQLASQMATQMAAQMQLSSNATPMIPSATNSASAVASTSQIPIPTVTEIHEPSPAPSDGSDGLSEFLKFAKVDVENTLLKDGLEKLGITHWTMFQSFTADELVNSGIPVGPARSIIKSAPLYVNYLKKHQSQ